MDFGIFAQLYCIACHTPFNTKDITWVAIFIATLTSITEVYSKKGFSNLFIPVVVLLALYVVEYFF